MKPKDRKAVFIFLTILFFSVGAFFIYMFGQHKNVMKKAEERHEKLIAQYQQKEITFETGPTLGFPE